MNVDLDINNYSLQDLLNLFNLNVDFSFEDLKNTKKIVLKTHPDKSKLPKEYFLFYSKAYKMLYHVFEFRSKTKKSFNDTYDNVVENSDETNKIIIKDMNNKEKFHSWFNRLFEKYYDKNDDGYGDWLSNESDNNKPDINNRQEMNNYIEEKKRSLSQKQSLIQQNYELNIPCSGENIYNNDEKNYANNDIFSKFQYEDVKKAHDETLIPVSQELYENKEKFNSVNDIKYKRSSENYTIMSEKESNQYLYKKNMNETNFASQKAFQLLKEEEKNVNNNNLFWSELKMLQMKK
tara:strand:- start:183 stop:1058 length:876 start_codon:yes stop_codon:yes gene_type:complete